MIDEQRRVLRDRAMTGIWIDDQLCTRYSLSQRECVDGGLHDVVVAVHN